MTIHTKICGLSTQEAVSTAALHGADYIGCVFFPPSPRYVTPRQASSITVTLPDHVKKVAVTVSMSNSELDALLTEFVPDYLQLHGTESLQRVHELRMRYGIPIIKALPVSSADDISIAHAYAVFSDMLLFDAKPPKDSTLPGGNGVAFDWSLLKDEYFDCPWFLSGGITCQNVRQAIEQSGANMVDISSGVESSPGVKDHTLIEQFLAVTRTL
jgi:phosphoribosylanthranilate isomerase